MFPFPLGVLVLAFPVLLLSLLIILLFGFPALPIFMAKPMKQEYQLHICFCKCTLFMHVTFEVGCYLLTLRTAASHQSCHHLPSPALPHHNQILPLEDTETEHTLVKVKPSSLE